MSLSVKVGINPIGWSNDDLPLLGEDTSLETALKEGAEIGYQGFELGNKFPNTGPELKDKLDEFAVDCVSGWYSANLAMLEGWSVDDEIKSSQEHMEKLAYNGCKTVVYGEVYGSIQGEIHTPLSLRPRFTHAEQWQQYALRLNEFGHYLKKTYDIKIAYHHHMGAYVETEKDVDQLMKLTDPEAVGLLFDTGHCWFAQANNNMDQVVDIEKILKKYIHRVNHVHCKDIRATVIRDARNRNCSFLETVLAGGFTVPGDGVIDFETIIQILSDYHYASWLVVEAEQDPQLAPSYRYAEKGFNNITKLVEKYQ